MPTEPRGDSRIVAGGSEKGGLTSVARRAVYYVYGNVMTASEFRFCRGAFLERQEHGPVRYPSSTN